jgi:hypothetical protein
MTAVDVVSFGFGMLGTVLGAVSIGLVFLIEHVRTPRVEFDLGQKYWPTQAGFAHVAVSNRRPIGWLGRRFRGVTVTGCRVSVELLRHGVSVVGPIDARWSGGPEPRDANDFPISYRWDLAATGIPE